jgi:hypothetical protein
MKHFINNSKKQILEKLKWFSSILDVVASIFKSFAMIIGSIVAGTTAGVTGYYEVKKVIKKEHHAVKLGTTTHGPAAAGEGGTLVPSGVSGAAPEPSGYQFDMNSGAFIISIVLLGVMVLNKFKKPPQT